MVKYTCVILSVLFIASMLFSINTLELIEPDAKVLNSQLIDYGTVGPGQTFTVQINPIVNGKDGEFLGQWDTAAANSLPEGWSARRSKIYDNPLIVEISVPKEAEEGEYTISILVEDEKAQENIGGTFEFKILVHISHNVLDLLVEPSSLGVGAGQPAKYLVTLHNTGSAKDVYTIHAQGVKGWEFEKKIYLPAGGSKSFNYEIVGNDQAQYIVNFYAESESSSLISDDAKVELNVKTNLLSDYKATSHGILLFPILQAPMYALAGLISLLFSELFLTGFFMEKNK